MSERMRRLLLLMPAGSEDASYLQRVLNTILLAFGGIAVILLVLTPLLFPQSLSRPTTNLSLILAATLIFWYLNRNGRSHLASRLFITLLWFMAALLCVTGGGVRVPTFAMFFLPTLLAYLLMGQREGTAVLILTILTSSTLLFAERRTSLLPPVQGVNAEWMWVAHTAVLIATSWLFNVATSNLRRSLDHSRQQEHLLQAVIRSTTNGILVIDLKGSVITANQQFLDLWGLPRNWVELPGIESGLVLMAEQTDNPAAFTARSHELLKDYSIEATDLIELKDGIIVQRHAQPYIIMDGTLIGRIYTYLDVTQQIRSEQALIFNSEFKGLITSISTHFINIPLAEIDEAINETLKRVGQFVGVDRTFVTLIFGSPARVTTRYFWNNGEVEPLEFDESLANFEQMFPWLIGRMRRNESIVISGLDDFPAEAVTEQKLVQQAGIKSVLLVPLVLNNTLIGYTGYDSVREQKVWSDDMVSLLRIMGEIFTNALERKRSEEALRASEEMFRSLTENSPIGIFMVDNNYRFIYVNDEYCRILGYPLSELMNRDFREILPEETRDELAENYRNRQQGGGVPPRYETRLQHRDGSLIWCEASMKAVRDSEGNIRTMGLIVDISDRKQAETRKLELAVEREKVELLRQFIANVSHDLKTPLSVIDTSLYLLRRNDDPIRAAEKLNIIQEQTRILSDFIQDLLMISRLEYVPQLDFKPVHLEKLLNTTLGQMRTRIESKNLRAHIKHYESVPVVLGAEDELSRVFRNLLENAINYTPDGGAVTCELDQQDSYLVVTVADTGIGISEQDLPYIFERFYRAEQARTAVSTGSGLGLAIVKKVIDLHQGKIEISSIPGQGTSFRVLLPMAPAAASKS